MQPIHGIYSSPLERALETAEPIARTHGLVTQPVQDLGEIDFGEWEGLTMEELDRREDWRRYNTYRSGVRCPGGELIVEAQTRMVQRLDCLRQKHLEETVAVVSHGDPLRSAIAYYLGIPLDLMLRFEISPASVSVVQAGAWGARVVCLNDTGAVPS